VTERFEADVTQAEEELIALALEGLNSGASIPADEKYWQEKRRGLVENSKASGSHPQRTLNVVR
jgi:hypothetical protein